MPNSTNISSLIALFIAYMIFNEIEVMRYLYYTIYGHDVNDVTLADTVFDVTPN